LGGGGALVFFWSPQASAENIIRTKSTITFFGILLLSMFNLLTISCASEESFLCDFTVENAGKLEIP
jgi:predicted membrane protein